MPDINTLPAPEEGRRPRGAVRINGTIIPLWESWEVDNNAYRAADTFRVTYPVNALPADHDIGWFSKQNSVDCEIFAATNPPDPDKWVPQESERLILGATDDIEYDPVTGILILTGRDWTAKLIDTKVTEGFLNKPASYVATTFAQRHGMTPVVTATTTTVGTYYTQNFVNLTQERSEWDILCELARFENFDVFVTGKELHFQPKPEPSKQRYSLVWTPPTDTIGWPDMNVTNIRFYRSLTIAKGVVVTVRSWHGKHKRAYSASWPKETRPTKPGQSGAADPLRYWFSVPNKTQDEALKIAKAHYDEIVRHMVRVEADLPGDDLLDASMIVQVRGTGTDWDQDYFPDSVKRSMSVDEGYRMTVGAKNISQDTETAAQ